MRDHQLSISFAALVSIICQHFWLCVIYLWLRTCWWSTNILYIYNLMYRASSLASFQMSSEQVLVDILMKLISTNDTRQIAKKTGHFIYKDNLFGDACAIKEIKKGSNSPKSLAIFHICSSFFLKFWFPNLLIWARKVGCTGLLAVALSWVFLTFDNNIFLFFLKKRTKIVGTPKFLYLFFYLTGRYNLPRLLSKTAIVYI